MDVNAKVFGYINGEPVNSRDEFVYKHRGFGPIEDDDGLIEYAREVTSDWQTAGHKTSFINFWLSDYPLAEPRYSLTAKEFKRLEQLQKEAVEKQQRIDSNKGWVLIDTVRYADNSVEEIWENRFGERKTVMVEQPHGDMC